MFILYPAMIALDELMTRSVYRFRTVQQSAAELKSKLDWAIEHCSREGAADEHPTTDLIFQLQESHREFEAVLKAELSTSNLFLLDQMSAFDTSTLLVEGHRAFPPDLPQKVPNAVPDFDEAMKCIAFELPTAAAFYLHRANEIVLGSYWDAVSQGEPRPKQQSLGFYLRGLSEKNFGSSFVVAALRDIKDLHRNPTMHADQTLKSVEEALDLQGAIRAAVGAMLRDIPISETDAG